MVAAARCLYHATIYSSINQLPFPLPALLSVPVRPCPNFVGWGRGSVATHLVFGCTLLYGAQALWVSCGLDRLSDGSGWRSYLYPFISPAPGIAARCSRPALSCQRHRHPRTWRANTIITRADRSGCAVTFTPSSHLRCYLYTFLPYLTLF